MNDPGESAEEILARTEGHPPTLGAGRLICIDGLAGAGKSTLARELQALRADAVVIGTDELLEGWGGLPGLGANIERLLRALTAGEPGTWRRWDWLAGAWAEEHTVEPVDLVILEGVGCAAASYDDLITTLVWMEAERDERLDRGIARDGEEMRALWEQWLIDEQHLHAQERTRDRADVVISTD